MSTALVFETVETVETAVVNDAVFAQVNRCEKFKFRHGELLVCGCKECEEFSANIQMLHISNGIVVGSSRGYSPIGFVR